MPDYTSWAGLLTPAPTQFGPDMKQIITLQNLAQQMQARRMVMQQEQQGQNALRQVFGNKDNIDQSTGLPKPSALGGVIQANPEMGGNLLRDISAVGHNKALAEAEQGKAFQGFQQAWVDKRKEAYAVYKQTLDTSGPEAALKAYNDSWAQGRADLASGYGAPPEWVNKIPQQAIPPEEALARNNSWDASHAKPMSQGEAARLDLERQDAKIETDAGKTPPVQYKIYKDGRTTDMAGNPYTPTGIAAPKGPEAETFTGTVTGSDGKPQPVTVRRNPTGGWIDDKNQPVAGEVTNLHKMSGAAGATASPEAIEATADLIARYKQAAPGSYAMSRGNGPEIMKAVREINPGYDATKFPAAQRARNSFAGSVDGRRVDAINTAVQHLGVLGDVEKELGNHDVNLVNRVINYASAELGHPEVTDFDTAKAIIADEVIKSVVGTGAVFDRAELQKNLNNARSPEQLQRQIERIKQLMAGATASLQKRWTSNFLPEEEFRDKLLPDTTEALDKYMPKSQRPQTSGPASPPPQPSASPPAAGGTPTLRRGHEQEDFDALPPGSYFFAPDGKRKYKP